MADKEKKTETWRNVGYLFQILKKSDLFVFCLMFFTLLFQAVLPLWQIYIPKRLLSLLISGVSSEKLFQNICFVGFITLLLQGCSTLTKRRYEAKISLVRTGIFRVMLIQKLFRMKYALFMEPTTRELTARAWNTTWSNNYGVEGVMRRLMEMMAAFLTLLGFVGTLLMLHPLIPILLFLLAGIDRKLLHKKSEIQLKLRKENIDVGQRLDYINETMQDLSFGKEIRIMGMGKFLIGWHKSLMKEKKVLFERERTDCAPADYLQILLAVLREVLIYGYLIYAVWQKGVSVADFSLYFAAAMSFSGTLNRLITHYEAFSRDAACIEDIREMMALPEEEMTELTLNYEDFAGKPIIFRKVSYRYPAAKQDAVSNFTYTFEAGKYYALVGENGSGKTTLIKLVCGLLEPDSGEILFGEVDGRKLSGWARYALFGMVFQDINLYAFTLGENTAMEEEYDPVRVHSALETAGLCVNTFPKGLNTILRRDFDPEGIDLSGGQRQCLAIARALCREGVMMTILDEPTAALDPIAEREIYNHLDRLLQRKSAIFISHRLASTRFCDEILVMQGGTLIEEGSHESLMALGGIYTQMFEAQSSFYREEGN